MTPDPWMACMRRGDFEGAWAISDRLLPSIADDESIRPRHLQRIWRGQELAGRRVLVRCYHGLGDTLQFVRFMPRLGATARDVILWVQPALIPLVQSVPGVDRLLPLHDGVPDVRFDVDVEIMELAHAFRVTLETLPRDVPYLHPPGPPLPHDRVPRLGIAWRGGEWNPDRSLPASLAHAIAEAFPGRVEVLQQALLPGEEAWFEPAAHDLSLEEAARLISACDLVVSVDTVFAHLAGALAKPLWLLLPADADWRWMQQRDDSPWYPTARLFRQAEAGGWEDVVRRVRENLSGWTTGRPNARRPARPGRDAAPPESRKG